jgi:hypothetical protein
VRSTDGGRSWAVSTPASGYYARLDVVSSRVVFATAPGRLLRTVNGGHSWQRLRPAPGGSAVDFWTASAGVAAATGGRNDRYYITRDAGRHWQRLRLPGWSLDNGGLQANLGDAVESSLCFAPGGTGWAVADRQPGQRAGLEGRGPTLARSAVLAAAALRRPRLSRCVGVSVRQLRGVAGCSADAVWVVVTQQDGSGSITATDLMHTTDLGRSWLDVLRATAHPTPPAPAVPSAPGGPGTLPAPLDWVSYLAAPSPDIVWLGLTDQMDLQDSFASTGDGGLTWHYWFLPDTAIVPPLRPRATTLPPQTFIWAMTALDARHAWLVLERSPNSGISWLYATGNRGDTWRKISTFRTPETSRR